MADAANSPGLLARVFTPGRDRGWAALGAVALALLLSWAAIFASGKDATDAFASLAEGAFGGPGPLGETSLKTAVLLMTGLSVAMPFVVGLFNIGAEGQLLWGAVVAAWLGHALPFPSALTIPLCLLGAAAAGGLWALVPAWLKVKRGVHEVISTILLNWVALHVIEGFLIPGPLRAPSTSASISLSGTAPIRAAAALPRLMRGSRLDLGIAIALALAAVLAWFLARTVRGYEWRAVGASPEAARAAGIPVQRRICESMAVAGALAGIAGCLLILGTERRFPSVFRSGYGFDGIAVALLGGSHPAGVALAALFFGAVRAGSTRLQIVGVHPSFAELMQGLSVLLVAAPRLFAPLLARLRRGQKPAAALEAAP